MTQQGDGIRIAWMTACGRTNAVQASDVDAAGVASTFRDISDLIVITCIGDTTTNDLDIGAMTNNLSRFYRIRLVR